MADCPCDDCHYAIEASNMSSKLDWHLQETFESGIRKTVDASVSLLE